MSAVNEKYANTDSCDEVVLSRRIYLEKPQNTVFLSNLENVSDLM